MASEPEFEARAMSAAGPVMLVALGLVLLSVLALPALLGFTWPSTLAWILAAVGVVSLATGFAWGALQAPSRTSRGA